MNTNDTTTPQMTTTPSGCAPIEPTLPPTGALGAIEVITPVGATDGCYPTGSQVRQPVIQENGRPGVNILSN